jgi:hypothetical protein
MHADIQDRLELRGVLNDSIKPKKSTLLRAVTAEA